MPVECSQGFERLVSVYLSQAPGYLRVPSHRWQILPSKLHSCCDSHQLTATAENHGSDFLTLDHGPVVCSGYYSCHMVPLTIRNMAAHNKFIRRSCLGRGRQSMLFLQPKCTILRMMFCHSGFSLLVLSYDGPGAAMICSVLFSSPLFAVHRQPRSTLGVCGISDGPSKDIT